MIFNPDEQYDRGWQAGRDAVVRLLEEQRGTFLYGTPSWTALNEAAKLAGVLEPENT